MYRWLGLSDTRLGMILLYTAVNVSLSVWLLKGFIDEIPREYEEAALVDGYSRLQAFRKVVLPQAATGIVATAIFCLIFAWNEYAFAVLLTSGQARTGPRWRRRPRSFSFPSSSSPCCCGRTCCAASPSGR
jgi:multiple sugar transport system permease protein